MAQWVKSLNGAGSNHYKGESLISGLAQRVKGSSTAAAVVWVAAVAWV